MLCRRKRHAGGLGWGDRHPKLSQQATGATNCRGTQPGESLDPRPLRAASPDAADCRWLQGFEDDYTLIPHRGRSAADGPRYKPIGVSMAVPVMCWIGMRIQIIHAMAG